MSGADANRFVSSENETCMLPDEDKGEELPLTAGCSRNQSGIVPFMPMNGKCAVTFTVEIYGIALDGSEWLIHRTTVLAFNPLAARKTASALLTARKKATRARVLNAQGETIYTINK